MANNQVIRFSGWDKFVPPDRSKAKVVRLRLKTGTGKTLRYPVHLVKNAKKYCRVVVIVPRKVHVHNNFNFHKKNKNLQGIAVKGACRQFNKWTTGQNKAGKPAVFDKRPSKHEVAGEIIYITAGSFERKL